jgi:hypothetical protein
MVVTRYVSYALALVVRQFGGVKHMPRTTRLSQFSRLFKDQSTLEVVKNIKQDWKLIVLVKKELDGLRDLVTSEKYPRWINLSLVTIPITLGFEAETSQVVEPIKKRINNKKELRE